MWRLASWGVGTVGALIVAILATRSPAAINRDQLASAELARQSQQVQWIAKESQNKARELAAAVDTLNGDRDRLYARVTVLEQGLDSVTGALARPAPASPPAASPAAAALRRQFFHPPLRLIPSDPSNQPRRKPNPWRSFQRSHRSPLRRHHHLRPPNRPSRKPRRPRPINLPLRP